MAITSEDSRHIALVGMMAVGKSTIGRRVADRLGRRFVDTDDEIESATGMTVRDLWERDGEAGYRLRERRAVVAALASADRVVLATPGGVVVDDEMAAAVQADDVVAVHLRATAETLAARVGGDDHRPLLGEDPATAIADLWRERAGSYEALADVIVDVDDRTADEVVDEVIAALDR